MRRFLFLCWIILALNAVAYAATYTAATCGSSDVAAAITSEQATPASGDIISIPSGTCTWSAQVTWTAPAGGIIHGAGSTSILGGNDQTIIIDNYGTNAPLLVLNINSSSTFRVYGLTIQSGTGVVKDAGAVSFNGSNQQVRIDHNHFNMSTGSGQPVMTKTSGWIEGVFDHNICDAGTGNTIAECINIEMPTYGGGVHGDNSWSADTGFGTSDFFFIEDNTLNFSQYFDDCSQGGRVVIRHNTITGSGAQTHPTGSGPRDRGCRGTEIYLNDVFADSTCNVGNLVGCRSQLSWLDSGPALQWNNTFHSFNGTIGTGYQYSIKGLSLRRDNTTYGKTGVPTDWGYCGTDSGLSGAGSNFDQNTSASTGYRCLDGLGQGKGDLLTGEFNGSNAAPSNSATGCVYTQSCVWPREALEPVYEWLETNSGIPSNCTSPCIFTNHDPTAIIQNSDIYLGDSTATTSGTNQTTSVRWGTSANRPGSCTTGVAYWATDAGTQGTLYKCTSTNTWTSYYQPYTYPHPLVSGCTPAKVVYTAQPSNAEVGSTLGTVSVSVEDSGGNVCTSDTSTVTLSSHSGSTAGTLQSSTSLSKAASSGVATWTDLFVSPTTGTISIDAADGALTGATSSAITISCTASKVVFTSQPGSTTIGSSLGTVTVAVQDSASITCSADTSSVTIANKGGTCTGMSLSGTATGNNIFSTSNLTENAAGACTLHATDGALTAADSSAFTISATAGGSTRGRMHR